MEPICTERLVIRNFVEDDWPELHEMIVGYQASAVAQYDQKWPTEPDAIRGVAAWFAQGDDFLAVCLRDGGKLVGMVALNPVEEGVRNLGYVFHFGYHGHGYATEACRAAIAYAFGALGCTRLASGTAPQNAPSVRLLHRLGFRPTEEEPQAYTLPLPAAKA